MFSDSKSLKKHVQAIPSKLKPYICQVCGHQPKEKQIDLLAEALQEPSSDHQNSPTPFNNGLELNPTVPANFFEDTQNKTDAVTSELVSPCAAIVREHFRNQSKESKDVGNENNIEKMDVSSEASSKVLESTIKKETEFFADFTKAKIDLEMWKLNPLNETQLQIYKDKIQQLDSKQINKMFVLRFCWISV